MAKKKVITIATPPDTSGTARVSLNKKEFDASIFNQGYDVWIDRAVKCPCKTKGVNNNLATCKNCGSTGWLFINRLQTKAIIYSMEWQNSYKEWSEENLGNAYLTVRDEDKLSFMDRITVLDADTVHKQLIYPFIHKGEAIGFTTYFIKDVMEIFAFKSDTEPLVLLERDVDYFVGSGEENIDQCKGLYDNVIRFSDTWKKVFNKQKLKKEQPSLTITYRHPPQYHVIHLAREAMVSVQLDGKGKPMPISAVGRRSHYVLDAENYNGDRLIDNSYDTNIN